MSRYLHSLHAFTQYLLKYDESMDILAGGPRGPSGGAGILTTSLDEASDGTVHAVSYWVREGRMNKTATWSAP